MKKAISAATSAALLASLLATAIAPAALATTAVTSVGSVGRGQTSTTAASFLFTENSADDIDAIGSFDVFILDSSGNCALPLTDAVNVAAATVHFVGAGTLSAPGSLDATLTVADHSFNLDIGAFDDLNVETMLVGGLQIKADTTAAAGAIKACVYNDTAGIFADAFANATSSATGKLSQAYGPTTTLWIVAVDATSPCIFSGTNSVTVGTETLAVTSVSANNVPVAGQQTFTTAAMANNHLANEVVTQSVPNCTSLVLGSPGSVIDSLIYNAPGGQTRLNPGETNQGEVFTLSASERTVGFLTASSTLKLEITTAGVTFSRAPNADVAANGTLLTLTGVTTGSTNVFGVLAADFKSVTWTVATKSGTVTPATGAPATITFDDIFYDVASTVATGTAVNVTLTASAGAVVPTSRSNAVVGRVLTVTATTPTVYIGENNQTAGQVTIVETGPGFFVAGAGNKNTFAICLGDPTQPMRFATAPWAKVTVGDLVLREGDVASTDKVVQGKVVTNGGNPDIFECYYWTVWTASTVASTVVISGDEAGTLGVKINIPAGLTPGPVEVGIRTGDILAPFFNNTLEARVSIGNRVFRNQVLVTALSQPLIPAGTGNALAGDIQIAETASGQLKDGQFICVEVLPRSSNDWSQDTFLKALITADLPIATGSGGVVVSSVNVSTQNCSNDSQSNNTSLIRSFRFRVNQQSITGLGKIVISNIHYGTMADAPSGPVLVNVYAQGAGNTNLDLQGVVSNAKIGTKKPIAISAVSALGLRPATGYTTRTPKYTTVGKYVTFKFGGGAALVGQRVNVLVAFKVGGAWGPVKYLKSAWADANGIVTFAWKSNTAAWVNVRVQWPGSAAYGVSYSKSLAAVVR